MIRNTTYIRERLLLTTSDDPIQFLTLILLPIGLIWLLYGSVETEKLLFWGLWNSTLVFAGYFGHSFNVKLIKTLPEHYLTSIALFFVCFSSACWVYAVFLITDQANIIQITGTIIIVIMVTAVSTLILSIFPLFYTIISVPVMSSLSAHIYTLNIQYHETLAMFPLLSLIILLSISRSTYITQLNGIKLREQIKSALKQSEQDRTKADAANASKTKFLAAVNHDMRQPVQAINYFVSSLNEITDEKNQQQLISRTLESIEGLSELLSALSDISRLDAKRTFIDKKHFKLDDLLHRLHNSYQDAFIEKDIQLDIAKTNISLFTDPALLERIMQNLISNALAYTVSGNVTITTKSESQHITLSIQDTGIGIDTDNQNKIFEEFYQVGNKERDRRKGLGLGLAIVRRLSETLELTLTTESRLGHGSTFNLTIPVGEEELIVDEEPTIAEHWSIDGLKLLLVDDEVDVRDSLCALLQTWNCDARSCASSADILSSSDNKNWKPDIILCDYRLIGETGAEAIGKLHQYYQQEMPAIIITGDTSPERLKAIVDTGYPLLHKPVSPAILRANIQQLL